MTSKLAPISLSRLEYSQLAELVKQHVADVKNPKNAITIIEGTAFNDFVIKLESTLIKFEAYIKNAQKSEFTEPLKQADISRETDLRAINRFMKLLQISNDAEEREAFRQLDIVWQVHKNLVNEVDENQSIGIDNLFMDMKADKLQHYVEVSGITRYLERVKASNDIYKDILKKRNAEYAERILKEGVRLHSNLINTYKPYCNFVASMVHLYPEDEQWNKIFSLLNVSRKKFAELLARRKNSSSNEQETEK